MKKSPAFLTPLASACLILFTGTSVLTPFSAQAQTQTLPPVVVTAADTEQPLARTIAHTTLLTEADIRRAGFFDLTSLLRGVAGVDYTQNGGLGASSSVTLRGSASTQVLVLIDGLRAGSATLGATALDQIMLDEVDHVEIVRGNVSALYGAAAVGGVIQVFTKRGSGPLRPNVSLEAGSHNTRRVSAGLRGAIGGAGGAEDATGLSLSVSHVRTDGISAQDPATSARINPDNDGYRNTSATASVSQRLAPGQQVGLRAYLSRGLSEVDNNFAPDTAATLQEVKSGTSELSGYWQAKWSPLWTSVLRLGVSQDRSHYTTRDATLGVDTTRFDTRTTQVDLKNEFRIDAGQLVSLGLQSVKQEVDSTTAYDLSSRRTDSLTTSYNGDYQWLQVHAALRHDRVSGGVSATTGLLGAALPLSEAVRVTASLSSAFNLPNFNQLYYPFFGNAALKPEKARSVELGAQYEANGILARAAWFQTRYRDLIDSPPPDYATINVNKARSEGVELSARAKIDDWTVRVNYTTQDPHDEATGQALNRRAQSFGGIEVQRDIGAWQVGGQITSVGDRRDGSRQLAGYTLVHLNAAWKVLPAWTLKARVTNLTNEVYSTVYSYNQPGREAFVGLVWQP